MTSKDVTCVINLPHRADRRRQMMKELSRVRWEAEFCPAVRPDNAGGFPSIGARGCFLSHMNVLRRARTAGVERLVILEDDLNFTKGFVEQWKGAIAELETREWSIFYPGHILEGLPAGLSLISPATGVQCSHFMVINGTAIQILIDGLEAILSRPPGHPLGGPMHVDGAYSTIRKSMPSLATYAYSPALGYQRPSPTDVGSTKWFDRIGMLKPVVAYTREIRARR